MHALGDLLGAPKIFSERGNHLGAVNMVAMMEKL